MSRRILLSLLVVVLSLIMAVPALAAPGQPNFGPAVFGDGKAWGTKGTTALPAPNDHNMQSYDRLFIITNSNNPDTQLPVSEAAPGNPNYNGGRWATYTVEWTQSGFDTHGTVPLLISYDELMVHYDLGHLTIVAGSPEGGPPPFFQCPLLPVK